MSIKLILDFLSFSWIYDYVFYTASPIHDYFCSFIQVAYPYCATCFGRCYPNGAALIIESRSTFDGVSQLLTVSPARGPKYPVDSAEAKPTSENGGDLVVDNATTSVDDSVLEDASTDESTKEPNRLESRSSI